MDKKADFDYKPDSVPAWIQAATTILLSDRYPELPAAETAPGAGHAIVPYLVLHRKGLALPPQSPDGAVGSCPTFSPLPANGRFAFCCAFLPAESGPQYPALQPGFLPCGVRTFLPASGAAVRRNPQMLNIIRADNSAKSVVEVARSARPRAKSV